MDPTSDPPASSNMSRVRRHRGNIPSLPQTKHCPLCPAKFTRTTHLNRHLRSHTNERDHCCERCQSQFTRSDLLTRHKRTCGDPVLANRSRRKSCEACAESKIKCDLEQPCSKCVSRDRECIFINDPKQSSNNLKPRRSRSKEAEMSPPALTLVISEDDVVPSASPTSSPATSPEASSSRLSSPLSTLSSLSSDLVSAEAPMRLCLEGLDGVAPPGHADFSKLFPAPFFGASINDLLFVQPSDTAKAREAYSFMASYPFYANAIPTHFYSADEGLATTLPPGPNGPAFGAVPSLQSESHNSDALASGPKGPSEQELQNYMYLFFAEFLTQIPVIHSATWLPDGKPPILLLAMRACGALFSDTPTAQDFISEALRSSREVLITEFSSSREATDEQTHLIMAVTLLQTVGLFHQRPDQRTSSSIYHGMVVMMIRRSGLIEQNVAWPVPDFNDPYQVEDAWRSWAAHEMIKSRALLLSYLHDCCQSIYFSLAPSFSPGEIRLHLPCDDPLWKAPSAQEWQGLLQAPSSAISPIDRLTGQSLQCTIANLGEMRRPPSAMVSDRFSLFILIHAILGDMYAASLRPSTPTSYLAPSKENPFALQSALHGWMQCWMNDASIADLGSDARFMFNPLPFYWLAQISLTSLQQGLPPLAAESYGRTVEASFRLVKRWLWRIRAFLRQGDQQPPAGVLWEELMRIRTETWRNEVGVDVGPESESEGLMAFFAKD
ncbi:hypothetical protein GLOTRDRAFT_49480 [Gloeophyllum trabeum ATCC 11539]|uniref:Zn(2)-C6 fungal-type domain-containing protein n=1 Tax=Gloeophyllum trabeum (strain ATCC 11539 / FP-39264 / Madison 617) TaxID=670483 RepID=S7PUE1_GLOTA|nr:uncharacterized protein GLOTRDRAFT_49480 [Gloeophyllum trabeum ATCC 11539]EPQ50947.1 hypothetical protein GLOTRDRAFT_49480 [Gloeophyllum trabeum ATCC 11539]